MCNAIVQDNVTIKPGQKAKVLMKGPGGYFEIEYTGAVLAGCATEEKLPWWKTQGEEVLIPAEGFGEKNKIRGGQGFGSLPKGSFLKGILMRQEPGKDYRVLKIVTMNGGGDATEKWGNDRIPVVVPPGGDPNRPGDASLANSASATREISQEDLFG
jgi:hypothetical protein